MQLEELLILERGLKSEGGYKELVTFNATDTGIRIKCIDFLPDEQLTVDCIREIISNTLKVCMPHKKEVSGKLIYDGKVKLKADIEAEDHLYTFDNYCTKAVDISQNPISKRFHLVGSDRKTHLLKHPPHNIGIGDYVILTKDSDQYIKGYKVELLTPDKFIDLFKNNSNIKSCLIDSMVKKLRV